MFPVALACLFGNFASAQLAAPSKDNVNIDNVNVKVLMLGDTGHHQPASLFRTIAKPLADVGVAIEYSDDTAATLKNERLNQFVPLRRDPAKAGSSCAPRRYRA